MFKSSKQINCPHLLEDLLHEASKHGGAGGRPNHLNRRDVANRHTRLREPLRSSQQWFWEGA